MRSAKTDCLNPATAVAAPGADGAGDSTTLDITAHRPLESDFGALVSPKGHSAVGVDDPLARVGVGSDEKTK